MAFSAIGLALGGVYFSVSVLVTLTPVISFQDGSSVAEHGFFYGYNGIVVTVILLQV
jgi:hypothetical protein